MSAFLFSAAANSAVVVSGHLTIEVLRGSGTNNNAARGVSISAVIRVLDERGKPVPEALVLFSAPASGPSVDFGGEGRFAVATTDESGTAAAPHERASVGNGPVEIRVMASKGGVTGNVSFYQMNLGVKAPGLRVSDQLEVINLTPAKPSSPEGQKPPVAPKLLKVSLRVETTSGKTVANATVRVTVRSISRSGKTSDLDRVSGTSNTSGLFSTILTLPHTRDTLEVVVHASANGISATRAFSVL